MRNLISSSRPGMRICQYFLLNMDKEQQFLTKIIAENLSGISLTNTGVWAKPLHSFFSIKIIEKIISSAYCKLLLRLVKNSIIYSVQLIL